MTVREELHTLIDDLLADDPRRALFAYRRLQRDEMPWLEHRVVAMARREGWSWAKIGRALGRRRQSVYERFARKAPTMRPDPDAQRHREQAEFRRTIRLIKAEDEEELFAW